MSSLQDKIEALSDAFQSTFTLLGDGTLGNMFHEDERPEVERLVKEHLGAQYVELEKFKGFDNESYAPWMIRWQ